MFAPMTAFRVMATSSAIPILKTSGATIQSQATTENWPTRPTQPTTDKTLLTFKKLPGQELLPDRHQASNATQSFAHLY